MLNKELLIYYSARVTNARLMYRLQSCFVPSRIIS